MSSEPWRERAACRGEPVEIFFIHERGKKPSPVALAICARCEVRHPCAVEGADEFGIWGGMSARERRRRMRTEGR